MIMSLLIALLQPLLRKASCDWVTIFRVETKRTQCDIRNQGSRLQTRYCRIPIYLAHLTMRGLFFILYIIGLTDGIMFRKVEKCRVMNPACGETIMRVN